MVIFFPFLWHPAYFLPIHFKTFPLGREARSEPMERLLNAIEPERIGWQDFGGTFRV